MRSRWCIVELQRVRTRTTRRRIEAYVAIENACARRRALVAPPHGLPPADADAARVGRRARPVLPRRPTTATARRPAGAPHDRLRQPRPGLAASSPIHPELAAPGHGTEAMRRTSCVARRCGPHARSLVRLGRRADRGLRRGDSASSRSRSRSCRRQHLPELRAGPGRPAVRRGGAARAATTSCCASSAPTPDDLLPALAEATAAINDAPLDDLEIEDEVFTRRPGPGLRERPARQRLPLLPDHRPAPRHRRARRPHGRRPSTRGPEHRPPARHVGRARATAGIGSGSCSRPT